MKWSVCCFVLATAFWLSACRSKSVEPAAYPVIEFRQTEYLDFSPYMEEFRYIWLEPGQESFFSEPDKMIVYRDKLFILDKTLKAVLCFDTTGRFNYRIQRVGKGPWEYQELNAMWVNPETDELWLEAYIPGKLMVFGTDGSRRYEMPVEWSSRDMARAGHKRIIGYNSTKAVHENKELGIGLFLMDEEGKLIKPLQNIGSSAWYYTMNYKRFLTEFDGGLLVISQSDTIYSVSDEGKVAIDFVADFGSLSMPASFRQLPYSEEVSKMFRESKYVQGKDQIVGFGPIRMFKIFLDSKIYFGLADINLRQGSFSNQIRHASGLIPIFIPECVTDRGELTGLLSTDMMMLLHESLTTLPSDPAVKALNSRTLELLNRGIQNDRPLVWFAPIKTQWLTQKKQLR